MKYILLPLFMMLSIYASGQKILFADKGNKWTYMEIENTFDHNIIVKRDTSHFNLWYADTVIKFKGLDYLHMKTNKSNLWPYGQHDGWLIRENNSGSVVYFLKYGIDTVESVLYDFNISIGDTIPGTRLGTPGFRVVNTIDTVHINNTKVNTWRDAYNGFYCIADGIGDLTYPFIFGQQRQMLGSNGFSLQFLTCFEHKGSNPIVSPPVKISFAIHDFDNLTSCADTLLEINETTSTQKALTVYPQPASSFVNINLPNEMSGSISIMNSVGQIVYREDFKQKSKLLINRTEQLQSGMYFYYINDLKTGISYTGKVLFE
jgi:hypothetical protein